MLANIQSQNLILDYQIHKTCTVSYAVPRRMQGGWALFRTGIIRRFYGVPVTSLRSPTVPPGMCIKKCKQGVLSGSISLLKTMVSNGYYTIICI